MSAAKKSKELFSWVWPIVIGVLIALCIRQWIAEPVRVPSASMYPTIPALDAQNQSYVLVNKIPIELGHIYRGEVVVFHWPDNPKKLFVKRIIGMPNDTVTVTEHAVYINGKKLVETNPGIAKSNGIHLGTWHVPPGHYFMMGDNRTISDDSRMWVHKYVAKSAIVGEAEFVLLPINKMTHINQSLQG